MKNSKIRFRKNQITKISQKQFNINCTGDCCVGDIVQFERGVFGGSYRKPEFLYNEEITAEIIKDSYGQAKQQHTFTILILATNGRKESQQTTIKGRNLYRNGTKRIAWNDESLRQSKIEEKHERGDQARQDRFERKQSKRYQTDYF